MLARYLTAYFKLQDFSFCVFLLPKSLFLITWYFNLITKKISAHQVYWYQYILTIHFPKGLSSRMGSFPLEIVICMQPMLGTKKSNLWLGSLFQFSQAAYLCSKAKLLHANYCFLGIHCNQILAGRHKLCHFYISICQRFSTWITSFVPYICTICGTQENEQFGV